MQLEHSLNPTVDARHLGSFAWCPERYGVRDYHVEGAQAEGSEARDAPRRDAFIYGTPWISGVCLLPSYWRNAICETRDQPATLDSDVALLAATEQRPVQSIPAA